MFQSQLKNKSYLEQHKGLIQLLNIKEQKGGRDAGAVCGVIKVDKGALIGALVTFHRR